MGSALDFVFSNKQFDRLTVHELEVSAELDLEELELILDLGCTCALREFTRDIDCGVGTVHELEACNDLDLEVFDWKLDLRCTVPILEWEEFELELV